MSHWLSQISSRFAIGHSLLLAVICDVTGASPDGDRGMLVLSEELIATNIINDKRRDLIIADAKKLMRKRAAWSDISYPLGRVLSKANGDCRVIYQYFDHTAKHEWIHDAQSVIDSGNNAWVVFRKGAGNSSSAITVMADEGNAALSGQLNQHLSIEADEQWFNTADTTIAGTKILATRSEQLLLLPVRAPADPVVVIGRHRVAIEIVRQMALLPLTVDWFAEEFRSSDPSGPLINRQSISALSLESQAAGSAVVVMSNDHQHDLQLCEKILLQPALNFVGCIGSSRKAALLKERLLANGISQSQLDKLHIPIGLPAITGKHPSLIATSVVAQILTVYDAGCDDHFIISER